MDMTDPYACVTLDRAAELIGGDEPISRTTIQRLIHAGILEVRGYGRLRRVTLASVNAYRKGETSWRGDVREAQAQRIKTDTASGGRKSQSETDATGGRVRLIGKMPSRNSKS